MGPPRRWLAPCGCVAASDRVASRLCGCATATPWPHDSLVCAVNAMACPTSERSLFRLEATAFTGQPHVEIYACVRILPMLDTSTFLAAGYSTAPPNTIASVRKLLRAARVSFFLAAWFSLCRRRRFPSASCVPLIACFFGVL